MNFTDIFIRRPVFATVISLLILLIGAISYTKLALRQYPEILTTQVGVTTTYAGASAQLMEGFISTPIENALSGINGIDYITSSNSFGMSVITVHFKLGYDINTAGADISNKVASIRSQLPSDIDDPIVAKIDPNEEPSLYISFTSDQLKDEAITDYLLRVVQPQLGTLPGVGEVVMLGERQYAMRIWLDPKLMAAHNITAQDISTALTANNLQSPSGQVQGFTNQLNVTASTDLTNAAQFNNLVIKNIGGNLVRLKTIGQAELGPEDNSFSAFINGKKAITLGIVPQPDANPLNVANLVNNALAKIKQQMPADLRATTVWDTSKFIAASIAEVKHTVFEATLAVILVIFLFLGSLRILFIPAVTIPLSLIGACAMMLALGFSINTLTLLAMVLAIGMVVDDSIVVSENIHRHIELGKSPLQAAIVGAREIQFVVISMTFTLAAVFAPIGFLTDITGALFREFAFTLAGTVIISGFIALTLSPMMCSKIMNQHTLDGGLTQLIDRTMKKIIAIYRKLLTKTLNHIFIVLLLVTGIAGLVAFLYFHTPQELAPAEDMGAVLAILSGPPSGNLAYTEKYSNELNHIYANIPEKENYAIINGYPGGINSAISFLVLKPWNERKQSINQVIQILFPQLWGITGLKAFPFNPFRLPGSDDMTPVKFILKTTGDYQGLAKVLNQLANDARKNPGFVNVDTDLSFDQPQINILIDRNKAADLGVSMSEISNALNLALSQPHIGKFVMNGRNYSVIPQLSAQYRNAPDAINNINVRTATGALVPLANLVKLKESAVPQKLEHFQQQRAGTLTASLAPSYSLGEALNFLATDAKKIMPETMNYDYGGTSRQFIQASGAMQQMFIFALLFIFLVLAAQFESFFAPLIVMFSVIPAIAGALITLKFMGGTMNIYTEIGLVTLIGLISKHGILMVEFANVQKEAGKSLRESIIEAASIRLRPILMTTAAMVLGAIPLALATGAGALSRQQIGWVIAGGMLFGTLVTLFVIPSAYITIKSLAARLRSEPNTDESQSIELIEPKIQ